MFANCTNLQSLDLSKFSTEKVEDLDYMFADDENLLTLDMSAFNTTKCKTFKKLFDHCYNLTVTLNPRISFNIYSEIPDYVKVINVNSKIASFYQ